MTGAERSEGKWAPSKEERACHGVGEGRSWRCIGVLICVSVQSTEA